MSIKIHSRRFGEKKKVPLVAMTSRQIWDKFKKLFQLVKYYEKKREDGRLTSREKLNYFRMTTAINVHGKELLRREELGILEVKIAKEMKYFAKTFKI